MTIRELYATAIEQREESLLLLLDFLLHEKRAIKLDDDTSVLNYYYQDRFHVKMNEYLSAHNEKRNIVKKETRPEVFHIKSENGRYFIAAHTEEQALTLFRERIGGEIYTIHPEPLHLTVFERGVERKWESIVQKVKVIPSLLGGYDY